MRQVLRQIGRAPVRILTSVFALALAVGAIGVLAIPTVSTSSLRDAAERDGIPQIVMSTSDVGSIDVTTSLGDVANVDRAESQLLTSVDVVTSDGVMGIDLLGVRLGDQQIDVINATSGRLPTGPDEILVTDGFATFAPLGSTIEADAGGTPMQLDVVGIGGSSFWTDSDLAFGSIDTVARLDGSVSANRVVVRTLDQGKDALRTTAGEVREALADDGIVTEALPLTIPDRRHPIEADIEQVSSLIGLLGIVAGLVALVLLASTANTLITERTREVAVMRALGASGRAMRRRLRRLALGIAAGAVVLGVPLGIVISNVIARMVLQEFVGLTPGFAVSLPVMIGSALFALVGARLVAAGAARRVTKRPLAEALRDRDGSPFGRRLSERLTARVAVGGLLDRTALRNGVHHRSRALAMLAQITAAVGALLVIASLATTVTDYNAAVIEPVNWGSRTFVAGPGLDIDRTVADGDPRSEVGTNITGEVDGWEIEVYGFLPDTEMIDLAMDEGRWFRDEGEVAMGAGFAERIGVEVGDRIDVELAVGRRSYTVVGLHPDRDRSVFVDVDELAADMNRPGFGNVLLSLDEQPATQLAGPVSIERYGDLSEDDEGTTAILLIFTAIGAIVVSVAGLAVASSLGVNIYERRHEFATIRAIGGRRRHVFRVVMAELLPLGLLGIGLGLVAGYFGAGAIMESFEASNAIEIGFTFATGAIPMAAAVVLSGSVVLGGLMVRRVSRQPAAVTLRGAS